MKTPMTLGQKKSRAIDQLLEELGVGMYIHMHSIIPEVINIYRVKANAY